MTRPPHIPRSTTRSRRRKQSGWQTTTGLAWQDVKDIHALAHKASFNVVLHIMPLEGTDAERKRFVSRTVGHLGQALKRRGQEHIGVTVYEKGPADLHGHHLLHVNPKNHDLLDHFDGKIVKVDRIRPSSIHDLIDYCTKQRKPLPPNFEARVTHRRQKGTPFRGRRASFTNSAKALLLERELQHLHPSPTVPSTRPPLKEPAPKTH